MFLFRSYLYSVARDCDNGNVNSKVGRVLGIFSLVCSFDFFGQTITQVVNISGLCWSNTMCSRKSDASCFAGK